MNVLEKNLAWLSQSQGGLAQRLRSLDPPAGIEVRQTATGRPVLVKNGLSLNSRRDPEREAENFVRAAVAKKIQDQGQTPLLYGLGTGYHALALARAFKRVIVFEPDPGLMALAFSLLDFSQVMGRLWFITATDELLEAGGHPVLVHQPTRRLHPAPLRLIEAGIPRLRASEKLRILVVSPIRGGSLPLTGHAAKALARLGHEVEIADFSSLDPLYQGIKTATRHPAAQDKAYARLTELAGEYVELKALESECQLVLALAQAPLNVPALLKLRKHGVATAFWFVEDYRLMRYFEELAPYYDHFFHIQDEQMSRRLTELGALSHHCLPLAADPEVFRPIQEPSILAPYRADVSFMGAGYPNRRRVFERLLGYDLKIWGTEWDLETPLGERVQDKGRRVPTGEACLIFNAAKVNLNLHSSVFTHGLDPQGAFLNPRTFEIAAASAFQLVDLRSPLVDYFKPGVEVAAFGSEEELMEKIDYYLNHPAQREAIGRAARTRVLAQHTYDHRMARLVQLVLA